MRLIAQCHRLTDSVRCRPDEDEDCRDREPGRGAPPKSWMHATTLGGRTSGVLTNLLKFPSVFAEFLRDVRSRRHICP